MLPPLPPELREHPGEEEQLDAELDARAERWDASERDRAQPTLAKAEAALRKGGVSNDRIESHVLARDEQESIADACIRAAAKYDCGTVVVGRSELSRMAEALHEHTGEALVGKARGLAIWVVE